MIRTLSFQFFNLSIVRFECLQASKRFLTRGQVKKMRERETREKFSTRTPCKIALQYPTNLDRRQRKNKPENSTARNGTGVSFTITSGCRIFLRLTYSRTTPHGVPRKYSPPQFRRYTNSLNSRLLEPRERKSAVSVRARGIVIKG